MTLYSFVSSLEIHSDNDMGELVDLGTMKTLTALPESSKKRKIRPSSSSESELDDLFALLE